MMPMPRKSLKQRYKDILYYRCSHHKLSTWHTDRVYQVSPFYWKLSSIQLFSWKKKISIFQNNIFYLYFWFWRILKTTKTNIAEFINSIRRIGRKNQMNLLVRFWKKQDLKISYLKIIIIFFLLFYYCKSCSHHLLKFGLKMAHLSALASTMTVSRTTRAGMP